MISNNNSSVFFKADTYNAKPALKNTPMASYKRHTLLLILLFSFVRIASATFLELGNDEAYYWLYSQKLQWNYFDHPPLIALWIRFFSANLSLEKFELAIRAGSIVGAALSSWFLFNACRLLYSEKAGWYVACLYNASFYAGITAGIYAMPDAPQMVFWTFALWMIVRVFKNEESWTNWLAFGAAAGLAIMSKVHGIFLWGGVFIFLALKKRPSFWKPQLWIAFALSMAISSPILIWNINNHFDTYRFHSQRVVINKFTPNAYTFFKEIIGQLFFNNPFNVVLIIIALRQAAKRRFHLSAAMWTFVLAGLPLSFILLGISLFRDTLPHWSGPAYVSLLPLAAIWMAGQSTTKMNRYCYLALGGHLLVLIALLLVVNLYPGTYGNKTSAFLGKGDVTLDMCGWQAAGAAFRKIYQADLNQRKIKPGTPLVAYKWWTAHEDYYFCDPANIKVIGLGPANNLHQYLWMNVERRNQVNMEQAFCIVPSDENYSVTYWFGHWYSTITIESTINVFRNGKPAKHFFIYRLQGWKGQIPLPN